MKKDVRIGRAEKVVAWIVYLTYILGVFLLLAAGLGFILYFGYDSLKIIGFTKFAIITGVMIAAATVLHLSGKLIYKLFNWAVKVLSV